MFRRTTSAFAPATSFTGLSFRPTSHPFVSRSQRPVRPSVRQTTRCLIAIEKIVNKSFQLEEDEDALSCTSAVYLGEDGTLSIGKTDGPVPDRVNANWKYSDVDGEILISIERYFEEDKAPFSVKRILRGHVDDTRKNLENLPVFAGAIFQDPADFSPNSEVGWFAMILAVDDLPSDDFDISSQ